MTASQCPRDASVLQPPSPEFESTLQDLNVPEPLSPWCEDLSCDSSLRSWQMGSEGSKMLLRGSWLRGTRWFGLIPLLRRLFSSCCWTSFLPGRRPGLNLMSAASRCFQLFRLVSGRDSAEEEAQT
ncbi:hypothetical protein GN956_G6415 [Arapaima gigas]